MTNRMGWNMRVLKFFLFFYLFLSLSSAAYADNLKTIKIVFPFGDPKRMNICFHPIRP